MCLKNKVKEIKIDYNNDLLIIYGKILFYIF